MSIIDRLKTKEDDGFKTGGKPYKDHLGFDTIGYGTRLPLSEKECEMLLIHRLDNITKELLVSRLDDDKKVEDIIYNLSDKRKEVLFEMAYQLGVPKTMKFKMWKAIEDGNFDRASVEMIQSRWYKQTPKRVGQLAKIFQRG